MLAFTIKGVAMFSRSKKRLSAAIGRLLNLTTAYRVVRDYEERTENRYDREIPVILIPWENNRPIVEAWGFALARNISHEGAGIVAHHELGTEQVLCIFSLEEPLFVLAEVKHSVPMGGCFWRLGARFVKLLRSDDLPEVGALIGAVESLIPCTGCSLEGTMAEAC
jgi:hypothetical protein